MTMTRREAGTIFGALVLYPILDAAAPPPAGKLIDVNKAGESELQQLPNITPAIATSDRPASSRAWRASSTAVGMSIGMRWSRSGAPM